LWPVSGVGFASGSPGWVAEGGQVRLPRHLFALLRAHDAIVGSDQAGLNQLDDPPGVPGVMPIVELAAWSGPNLTLLSAGRGSGSRRRATRSRRA